VSRIRRFPHLRNNPGFIASGEIQRIGSEKRSYTPSNVSRRLRELENDGLIEVRYIKNHAHYRAAPDVDALWPSIEDQRAAV
jgi:DNA-binding transcriptional ArsR family regulator